MKLLICDDEDLIRKSLARAFRAQGHEVLEAENGLVGLNLLKSNEVDLIILDLLMPEKNGFDFLSEMKILKPVIIISAFSGQQQGHFHADDYPQVIGFIKKPFDHLNLVTQEMTKVYENYIRKI
jgi:two-component system, response regulator PdtaR